MRIETVIKRESQAIGRVRDLYSRAKFFGPTSAEMNEEYSRIIAEMGNAPRYAVCLVDGYRKALTDSLYENHLVFGAFVNGEFYSTHSNRTDYYQKHGIEPVEFSRLQNKSGHYWVLESGAVKPFFVSETFFVSEN